MACVSKALIIGGGIAGLSAAIALSRVGVTCDVVELTGSPLGASLGVSGRAAEALDELGVYERCYETSRPFSRISSRPGRPPRGWRMNLSWAAKTASTISAGVASWPTATPRRRSWASTRGGIG